MIQQTPGGRWYQDVVELRADLPTCWITRDSTREGVLGDICDLWIGAPPVRAVNEKGASWVCSADVVTDDSYLGPYSVAAVSKWCGTVPETDSEMIRRG